MRIIPVIDLRNGRAVRGQSGDRARYRPVQSRLAGDAARNLSDPLSLLAAYRETLRPGIVYVADLDRILGCGDHDALLGRLVEAAPEACFLWDGGSRMRLRSPELRATHGSRLSSAPRRCVRSRSCSGCTGPERGAVRS